MFLWLCHVPGDHDYSYGYLNLCVRPVLKKQRRRLKTWVWQQRWSTTGGMRRLVVCPRATRPQPAASGCPLGGPADGARGWFCTAFPDHDIDIEFAMACCVRSWSTLMLSGGRWDAVSCGVSGCRLCGQGLRDERCGMSPCCGCHRESCEIRFSPRLGGLSVIEIESNSWRSSGCRRVKLPAL